MKKFFLPIIAFIFLGSFKSIGQGTGKVTGSVTDNKDKAIAAVTISLLQPADSSLIKAAVTDASGKFEIPVTKAGSYLLSYSAVGYEKKYSPVFEVTDGQSVAVKPEILATDPMKLQGVTVTSKKPMIEVKADKTVFNVEASITATGSNALELLQKSPGMQVDNNDNISMKGKTGE